MENNDSYYLKVSGKAEIPHPITIGHNFHTSLEGSVISETISDNEEVIGLAEIGKLFNRDHSTVIHALKEWNEPKKRKYNAFLTWLQTQSENK